jgi:hypothetical protein
MVKNTGAAEARRQAQELLSNKQEAERLSLRDRERRAEAQKTAHLRELRLAKEAQEKAAKDAAKSRAETARRAAGKGRK